VDSWNAFKEVLEFQVQLFDALLEITGIVI
jgi:hypothetical protein